MKSDATLTIGTLLGRVKRRTMLRTRYRAAVRWLVHTPYDLLCDYRAGLRTGGLEESPFRSVGMHTTKSTPYWELARLFAQPEVRITPDDVLVDVGCGKGRVIAWWLLSGLRNKMVGIELTDDVAARTAAVFGAHRNVKVLAGSALELAVPDATFYYMFNPFDRPVMAAFKDHLKKVHRGQSSVRILYHRARFLDVFADDPDCTCVLMPTTWLNPVETETWLITLRPPAA